MPSSNIRCSSVERIILSSLFYKWRKAVIGSILDALYAGCRLANTEIAITIPESSNRSSGATLA
jgi:hypothetical protein